MAHIVVEVTSNLTRGLDTPRLLRDVNQAVDGVAGLRGVDLKTRLVSFEHFAVGVDEASNAGFVAVEVQTFHGKSAEEIDALHGAVLPVLDTHFPTADSSRRLDLSVRVSELTRDHYNRLRSISWPAPTTTKQES